MHAAEPLAEILPYEHGKQLILPAFIEYVPGVQLAHAEELPAAIVVE